MSGPQLDHAGINARGETQAKAEAGIFGFWVFLMSDAVIFALLFALYGTMVANIANGPAPGETLELMPAFIETVLLLASSLTFGIGVLAMKYDRGTRRVVIWMAVTLTLGLAFVALELRDFAIMFSDGAYPTRSGFLSAFFALVPLHGLHVLGGCVWMAVMFAQIRIYGFDDRTRLNMLRASLFWHFLDVIWIAIFSVVYLQAHLP